MEGVFLIDGFGARAVARVWTKAETPDDLLFAAKLSIVSETVGIVSALLFMAVVSRIARAQASKGAAMAVPAG